MITREGDCYDLDQRIAEIIHEGFNRLRDRKFIRDFIQAANKEIVDNCGSNIDITGELGYINITKIKGAYINNSERLKVVLGEDFVKMVRDNEIATAALIELACDADDPRAPEVRGCITLKDIITLEWHVDDVTAYC